MRVYKLRATTALSHGDPGKPKTGNVTPFRTEEILHPRFDPRTVGKEGMEGEEIRTHDLLQAEELIAELMREFPLQEGNRVALALDTLTAEQVVASAYVYMLISELNRLNGGQGAGLFGGMERYNYLRSRIAITAGSIAGSLFGFHAVLMKQLQINETIKGFTDVLPLFFSLPKSVQLSVIASLRDYAPAIIDGIARPWATFEQGNRGKVDGGMFTVAPTYYNPKGHVMGTSLTEAESSVPSVSSNSFRHQFRDALLNDLLMRVGLGSVESAVLNDLINRAIVMMFSNGGNMLANATAPANSATIDAKIREVFQILDLFGGSLPSRILPGGALLLGTHVLCAQNNESTTALGYTSDVDAAALLTEVTFTRGTPDGMGHSKEDGQMIFSTSALKAGAQLALSIRFSNQFTSELTRGAFYHALRLWLLDGGIVGGRSAQGFGGNFRLIGSKVLPGDHFSGDDEAALADAYVQYIEDNKEMLKEALTSGTLGWKVAVA